LKIGIRTKLICSFLIISLFFIVCLGIVSKEVRDVDVTILQMQEEAHKVELTDHLQLLLNKFLQPANNYLITGEVKERDNFDQLSGEIFRIMKELQVYQGGQRWEILSGELNQDVLRLSEQLVAILFMDNPVGNARAAQLIHDATTYSEEMIKKADEFHNLSEQEMIRMAQDAKANNKNVDLVFYSTIAGSALFFILISIYVSRFFIRPILDLHRGAQIVRQGNLSYRLEVRTKDEIESLANEFNRMVEAISHMKDELDKKVELSHQLAITDPLTGLFNRRFFMEKLREETKRNERFNHPLSIVLIDIDNFKVYNDNNGHLKGDDLLRSLSAILKRQVRSVDCVCRIGGEEFMVILPETDYSTGLKIAEGLRKAVESYPFPFGENQPGGALTISLGVASSVKGEKDPLKLIKAADDALYHAKRTGRNRIGSIE